MKRPLTFLVIFMAAMLAGACTPKVKDKPDAPVENMMEALGETEEVIPLSLDGFVVSTAWLEEHLTHPDVVMLHTGNDRSAWASAHIPGQAYVAFDSIVVGSMERGFELPDIGELREVYKAAGVDDNKVVILTGDMEGLLAARSFFSLEVLGLTKNVAILDGGVEQWLEEERPISDVVDKPVRGSISTTSNMSLVVSAAKVLEMLGDDRYQLVDARPADEFSGVKPGMAIERGGHIPDAVNIFWKDTLLKKDRPLLMPLDEIENIYAAAGVATDATIVTYCRTGVQASFGYLVARMLGRDAVMYDGSYIDWIRDHDRPIAQ